MTAIQARDAVTGAVVDARHDGHHVVISEDGVDILHLNSSAALALASRISGAAATLAGGVE